MGLCGCFGSATVADEEYNPIEAKRKCRDVFCILLFAVYWVGMLAVFAVGLATGEPERLVYAVDYHGDTCGVEGENSDGLQDKQYVYYPRIDLDVQEGLSAGKSWEDIDFYGVCLDDCPEPLPNNAGYDYVCNYETEALVKADMTADTENFDTEGAAAYEDTTQRALYIQADFETGYYVGLTLYGGKYTSGCWPVDIKTSNLLFRCFWEFDEDVNKTEICTYPGDTEEYYTIKPKYDEDGHVFPEGGISANKEQGEYWYPNEDCKTKLSITVSEALAPANDNPLLDQLESWVSVIRRMYSDLETTWLYIFLIGGLGTTVFAFLFLELMQLFAGFITWLVVSVVVILSAGLTLFCAWKGGLITSDDIDVVNDAFSGTVTEISGEIELQGDLEADNEQTYEILFYIMCVITIVLFVMILFFRKKIQITVEIVREASSCIQTMPLLVFFPLIPFVWSLLNLGYFIVSTSYLLTAGDFTDTLLNATSTIDDAANDATTRMLLQNSFRHLTENATNTSDIDTDVDLTSLVSLGLSSVDADDALFYMMWYNLFGFFWTNQLIQAVSMCTIAGACSRWYWSRSKTSDEMGKWPIRDSFKNCFRYHLGSLLFGAFLVAVVQLLRAILIYIDHQTKKLQDNNILVKIILKIAHCCLWCLEKCMKFITKNSYIIIAMTGSSFFAACKRAFGLIFSNLAQIGIVATVSSFVLNLAKLSMCVGGGVLMFTYIENNEDYSAYGDKPLSYPIFPALMTMLMAYYVAATFLNVFSLCIDTILLAFCMDKEKNKAGSFYMSDSLQKLIGKYKDTSKEAPAEVPAGE